MKKFLVLSLIITSCGSGEALKGESLPTTLEILLEHPTNKCLNKVLDRFVDVFGVYIISTSEIPDEYILHSANILAQFIDNDEDGTPDDQNVLTFLQEEKFVVPVWNEKLREEVFESLDWDNCSASFAASMYYGDDEWAIGGIESAGSWDTNLEEIWHIVSTGWYASYPEYFGDGDSKLLEAMDKARGGKFLKIPEEYPPEAWYAYYDDTCDYYCQSHEYFYWILMSNIDALDPSLTSKCRDSKDEWPICNKKELEEIDSLAFELLNNYGFNFPTKIPDGSYKGKPISINNQAFGSSSESSQERDPESQILNGGVIEDESFDSFTRYIDVAGLRIFVLPEVSSEFISKVAEVYGLMFEENEYFDETLRNRYLKRTEEDFAFQRIGYLGPENYGLDSENPKVSCCPGKNYEDNHVDYIWEYPGADADLQIREIVEHLLHTVTSVGFALEFPEWNWLYINSEIHLAMNEAVEKNIYDISSYEEIKNRGNITAFNRITVQEFAFWVIVTEWGYADIFNLPNEEFSIGTSSDLKEQLPLSHKLYEDTIKKILTPPDKNYLRSLFK